jgi:hypothetical protein
MFIARGIASALWLIGRGHVPTEAIVEADGPTSFVFADIPDSDRNRLLGEFLDGKDQLRLLSNAAARKAVTK